MDTVTTTGTNNTRLSTAVTSSTISPQNEINYLISESITTTTINATYKDIHLLHRTTVSEYLYGLCTDRMHITRSMQMYTLAITFVKENHVDYS
ncbi:hypothetical protein EWB00_006957 [Schistosoma japonicum]|uniref:Uncharacterized protein n=1 Tax=Schistosoma japonicum TaxID=6182 RepID=A0A4Z2CWK7_SCHJA|nr:hypothetical protein EWB00_006957 [Schistosoma japonicum]